jgi:hypothetical protein
MGSTAIIYCTFFDGPHTRSAFELVYVMYALCFKL